MSGLIERPEAGLDDSEEGEGVCACVLRYYGLGLCFREGEHYEMKIQAVKILAS